MKKRGTAVIIILTFLGLPSSAKVIDLFERIDDVRVNESTLLHTWLRDPLEGKWKRVSREAGGEIWSTEIAFPVTPRHLRWKVTYQGTPIPSRAGMEDPEGRVHASLFVPEPENLRCRSMFERNGSVSREVTFRRTDRAFIRMRARGDHAVGIYPVAELRVDALPLLKWDVNASVWRIYIGSFKPPVSEGKLQLAFVNDGTNKRNGEDRNLYVDQGEIVYPSIVSIHLPAEQVQAYETGGFEFQIFPEVEEILPALTQGAFLSPFVVKGDPVGARDILGHVEVNSCSRRALRLVSPSDLEWPLELPPGKNRLEFALSSDDYGGVGSTLRLAVENADEPVTVWEKFVPPPQSRSDADWIEYVVDLTPWQGKTITLRLVVSAGMPLHGPFARDKSNEKSSALLFANPVLITEEETRATPNLILISLDTLRADHLSCYGYHRETSPALDRFAEEAVRFDYCVSAGNMTLSSHGSLFTSLLAREHGVYGRRTQMKPSSITMAGVLRGAGYRTVAFVDGGFMDPYYGFFQGFDVYNAKAGRARAVFPRAMQWMKEKGRSNPFFIFIHVYDVHAPYNAEAMDGGYRLLFDPLPHYDRIPDLIDVAYTETLVRIDRGELAVNRQDVARIVVLYDAGVRLLDDGLAGLLDFLEEEAYFDDSLVVVMSDHGEHFGERGYWMHESDSLYRELLHVPLLMRFPGEGHAGAVIEEPVSLMDLFPTFAEYVGAPIPDSCRGRSLLRLIEGKGETPLRDLLSEEVKRGVISLTSREVKGILRYSSDPALTDLYDMRYDRQERVNLVDREQAAVEDIKKRLVTVVEEAGEPEGEIDEEDLDPELAAQLEALGYLAR